jgi:hypothetical protein
VSVTEELALEVNKNDYNAVKTVDEELVKDWTLWVRNVDRVTDELKNLGLPLKKSA